LFEQATGHDLRAGWVADMQRAVESDWGVRSDDRFHLTRQGMRFADTVAEWFIRPEP
jgi:coproporphyrinogen III oxidase-like Fe-S oxidoreductase